MNSPLHTPNQKTGGLTGPHFGAIWVNSTTNTTPRVKVSCLQDQWPQDNPRKTKFTLTIWNLTLYYILDLGVVLDFPKQDFE